MDVGKNYPVHAQASAPIKAAYSSTRVVTNTNTAKNCTKDPLRTRHQAKNPINKGSKDPLKPPSSSLDYTLFSGVPINKLTSPKNLQDRKALQKKALDTPRHNPIICGKFQQNIDWKRLANLEKDEIAKGSTFGVALAILTIRDARQPPLHSSLHLLPWFMRLRKVGTIEAADGYWGVSRGVEILPKNLQRDPTSTPNYYKKEHEAHVQEEVERVMKDGHLLPYEKIKEIWQDAPEVPFDKVALGFLVKDKIDASTGRVKKSLGY